MHREFSASIGCSPQVKQMVLFLRTFNALLIYVLMTIVSISIGIQILGHQLPCAYCILQRSLMVATSIAISFNLTFGLSIRHYALALFSSLLGAAIALRQMALHACPQFPIFGNPFLCLSLYTWSFLIFSSSLLAIAIFLALHTPGSEKKQTPNLFEQTACLFTLLIATLLVLLTFQQCGLGDCKGTANAAIYTKPRNFLHR